MLIALCGGLGTGKTLGLTWLGWRAYLARRKIYSNYHVTFPYEPVTKFEDVDGMIKGYALLDEVWLWLDARMSSSKRNKAIAGILLKSRKRDMDLAFTAQSFRQIDVRMRNVTDYLIKPKLYRKNRFCALSIYSNPPGKPLKVFKFKSEDVFPMYDTREEIQDIEEVKK